MCVSSGARRLEVVCWFGAMSIIANYLVFVTFFPASLSLVMEVGTHSTHHQLVLVSPSPLYPGVSVRPVQHHMAAG